MELFQKDGITDSELWTLVDDIFPENNDGMQNGTRDKSWTSRDDQIQRHRSSSQSHNDHHERFYNNEKGIHRSRSRSRSRSRTHRSRSRLNNSSRSYHDNNTPGNNKEQKMRNEVIF